MSPKPGPKPKPKNLQRIDVALRLPRWMVSLIDQRSEGSTRTSWIEDAIREKLGQEEPKESKNAETT